MFFRIAAVTIIVAFMVTASLAQTPQPAATAGIMSEVSNAQMHAILQGMGFEFTEKKTDDSYVFVFQLGGYKVTLLNQGQDMQLYSGFSDKISLSKINGWNQKYRFGRAYGNDEGGGSLEDDLNFAGGVTKDTIEEFIKQFRATLTTFVKFLNENPKSDPAPTTKAAPPASPDTKPETARLDVKIPNSGFTVSIDGTKWKQTKSDESGVLLFANNNGEGYAKIISERIALPLDTLRNAALTNMRKSDPNAKVVMEEKRIVNGKPVIALQVDLTTSNIPFRFYGYCYSGSSGSLQIWTFTAASVFDNNVAAFTEFLNGFTSADEPLPGQPPAATPAGAPSAGMLSLLGGKMSLQYDPKKWTQKPVEEQGRFRFSHVSGDGYALVISERIGVDMDAFPDIALTNARSADPNAKIVVREKRKVNGADVWYLQIDAVVDKIPFVYNGYYYSSDSGTVQVLTYTGKTLIREYEKDFLEFLNGFRATP